MVWSEFICHEIAIQPLYKKFSNTSIVLNLKLYYIHIEFFFHVFKSSQYFQYVDFWLQETLWELSPINCNSFKKKASTGYLRTQSIVKNYKIGHFQHTGNTCINQPLPHLVCLRARSISPRDHQTYNLRISAWPRLGLKVQLVVCTVSVQNSSWLC